MWWHWVIAFICHEYYIWIKCQYKAVIEFLTLECCVPIKIHRNESNETLQALKSHSHRIRSEDFFASWQCKATLPSTNCAQIWRIWQHQISGCFWNWRRFWKNRYFSFDAKILVVCRWPKGNQNEKVNRKFRKMCSNT